MVETRFEQTRINQLTSTYGPDEAPRLPLDFGDYLSILWRMDQAVGQPARVDYYRACAQALGEALDINRLRLFRLIENTPPGQIYEQLPNVPYRGTNRLIDAHDRKAAIRQLITLRNDVLRIGTYQDQWPVSWPGSGIVDRELRERVFAVLFTALQGQFGTFGRLLLIIDIVLSDLLLGYHDVREAKLSDLVQSFNYPNPNDSKVRWRFYNGDATPE